MLRFVVQRTCRTIDFMQIQTSFRRTTRRTTIPTIHVTIIVCEIVFKQSCTICRTINYCIVYGPLSPFIYFGRLASIWGEKNGVDRRDDFENPAINLSVYLQPIVVQIAQRSPAAPTTGRDGGVPVGHVRSREAGKRTNQATSSGQRFITCHSRASHRLPVISWLWAPRVRWVQCDLLSSKISSHRSIVSFSQELFSCTKTDFEFSPLSFFFRPL